VPRRRPAPPPAWTPRPSSPGTLRCYVVNGKTFIVYLFASGGWELYRPAHDGNSTARTLDEAAVFLGCEGCRGLVPDGPATTGEGR
jgi:hypothetical protein